MSANTPLAVNAKEFDMRVTRIIFSLGLLFSTVSYAASDQVKVVSEGIVDLGNQFAFGKPTAPVTPPGITRPYALRTTYQWIKGVTARLKKTVVPEATQCGDYDCYTTPSHLRAELDFEDPRMSLTWELIDPATGYRVGVVREALTIPIVERFPLSTVPKMDGIRELPDMKTSASDSSGHVSFQMLPDQYPNNYILSFQRMYAAGKRRLEGARVVLTAAGDDVYRLDSIEFDTDRLRRDYRVTGPTLDVDRERIGYYYLIGGPGSKYSNYDERLVEFSP
jgi:hypothetical protein